MTEPTGTQRTAEVSAACRELAHADSPEGQQRLLDALAGADRRAALRPLGQWPAALLRLDARSRGSRLTRAGRSTLDAVATRLRHDASDPVTCALATMHPDGQTREAAVRRLLVAPVPEHLPFLVLRCGDWVPQVRRAARAGLVNLFAEHPADAVPAAAGAVFATRGRARGGFAAEQLELAVAIAPRALFDAAPDPRLRTFAVRIGIERGRYSRAELGALAADFPDRRVRAAAAEAACRDAVWSNGVAMLRRLADNTDPRVRVLALTGLVRSGRDTDAAGRLDDTSSLVRALARDAARRTGTDSLAYYRAAVRADAVTPGAVAGLAETGGPGDAEKLRPLLEHPAARIREAAVPALRALGVVPSDALLELLHDPSARVVRAAAGVLVRHAHDVPDERLWPLLSAVRPAQRRAGYQLLRPRGVPVMLRAALTVFADPHANLARRADADLRGLLGPSWRPPVRYPVAPAEYAELLALIDAAGPPYAERLRALLAPT